MGCFTACLKHLKHKKTIKSRGKTVHAPSKHHCLKSLLHTHEVDEITAKDARVKDTIKPIADSKKDDDELLNKSHGVNGAVTKQYQIENSVKSISDSKKEDELLSKSHDVSGAVTKQCQIENSVKHIADSNEEERQLNRSNRKKVTFDLNVKTYEECSSQEDEKKEELEISSDSSLISYPLNHRYHNCRNGDDDDDDEELEDLGLEEDIDGLIQEESSESLFSLSIESRKSVTPPEMPDKEEVSSELKNQFVQSVLSPVENMSQWKVAKSESPFEPPEKESKNLDLERGKENEIAVDTSLSSWLVGTEKKTPQSSNDSSPSSDQRRKMSPKEFEERPILGSLSVEELKVSSKSSSPRTILGTVGNYWRHTGQASDSDSGSSCKGTSDGSRRTGETIQTNQSIPFQIRFESSVDFKINAASNFSS